MILPIIAVGLFAYGVVVHKADRAAGFGLMGLSILVGAAYSFGGG